MSAVRAGPAFWLALALPCLAAACAAAPPLDREVRLAKHGEDVLAGMDDVEVARGATIARLERLEELVREAPLRADVRAMLVSGWARYALLFAEDDVEEAKERGDGPTAGYHAMRARNAYERALHHAREVLGGPAFDAAVTGDRVQAFLAARTGDDPEILLWAGAAWIGRLRVAPEDRKQLAAQAYAGEALIERALALDPDVRGGYAHALLGLWRGRPGGEAERARQHFDRALEASSRKLLLTQVFLARTIVCQAHDRERWDALFKEVLEAKDPAPELRVDNAVAKRRAARDINGIRRAQCVP